LLQFESDYPEYAMHPVIKSCLTMDWYMYGPIFDGCGGKSPQTVSKMQLIEIQVSKWKNDLHGKVSTICILVALT